MNRQRILWFQDGVKLKVPITQWGQIDTLTQALVALAGNTAFDHAIVDPLPCADNLFKQTNMKDYSCIVDLSGFFGNVIRDTFSNVSVVGNFHLSRIRVVSSSRLDGSGFLVNLNRKEVASLKDNIDFSKPLFLDDVSWSGRTISEAIRILGLDPKTATVGLLVANRGTFGEGKPGAFDILKEKGIQILAGDTVSTPQDDGFHVADFLNFNLNEIVFDDILKIWEKRAESQTLSGQAKKDSEDEIRNILTRNKEALFPKAISSEEMKLLQEQGRLYQYEWDSKKSNVRH